MHMKPPQSTEHEELKSLVSRAQVSLGKPLTRAKRRCDPAARTHVAPPHCCHARLIIEDVNPEHGIIIFIPSPPPKVIDELESTLPNWVERLMPRSCFPAFVVRPRTRACRLALSRRRLPDRADRAACRAPRALSRAPRPRPMLAARLAAGPHRPVPRRPIPRASHPQTRMFHPSSPNLHAARPAAGPQIPRRPLPCTSHPQTRISYHLKTTLSFSRSTC